MKRYLPAILIIMATAAFLAGPAAAQEEEGGPAPESGRKEIKIITPGAASVGDEELLSAPETCAPGDGKHVRKETVIMPFTILSLTTLIFWIAVAAVVIIAIIMGHRNTRLRYDVIQLAIKEGKELPPDIFRNGYRRRRRDPLLAGLVLTALGVALAIALGAVAGWVQAVWGLIPLFIGIAFLVYVPYYRKQKKENGD